MTLQIQHNLLFPNFRSIEEILKISLKQSFKQNRTNAEKDNLSAIKSTMSYEIPPKKKMNKTPKTESNPKKGDKTYEPSMEDNGLLNFHAVSGLDENEKD